MSTKRTGAEDGVEEDAAARSSVRAWWGVMRERWERASERIWEMGLDAGGGVGAVIVRWLKWWMARTVVLVHSC